MLQDAITSKVDKATTVVIDIMATTRRTTVATATTAAPASVAVPEVEDANVLDPETDASTDAETDASTDAETDASTDAEDAASTNFFDQFASDEAGQEKTREDIVAELLLRPNVKKLSGLHIRNVVTNTTKDMPFLTFVLKEWIIGDTRGTSTDAFGVPEVVLGKTHNAVVSAYAVSAVMKDSPKTAVFAQRVAEGSDVANILFAGGTIDLLMEYVAAGETYVNPFSTAATETVFDRGHVIIHVLALNLGEAGRDAYMAMLSRI